MPVEPDFGNSTWLMTKGPVRYCFENPDAEVCEEVRTLYEYRLSLAANAIFLVIFSLSLIGFLTTRIMTRIGTGFTVALSLGVFSEILGYAGRVIGHLNPWDPSGFYMQICCLTFGPAFMAAGIYLCLRRIVAAFGPENSRIKPELYTRIFIPCDTVALVLQALGGGLAASSDDPKLGTNIMIAGLVFQVLTGLGFIIASVDFALRTLRRYRAMGASAMDQSPGLSAMRRTTLFKCFLGGLAFSSFCILVRSCFRVAELSEGWTGPIMAREDLFIGFEGVLIVLAVLTLNVLHPAICMRPVMESSGGYKPIGFKKRGNNEEEMVGLKNYHASQSAIV